MTAGCDILECGEPVLAEGVCYDHAKTCTRCDGPSRCGRCENAAACSERLDQKMVRDASARGEL